MSKKYREHNIPLCHASSLAPTMTSTVKVCFYIFLLKLELGIIHGSEEKPIKGETCSVGGGPSIGHEEENPCFTDGQLYSPSSFRLTRREGKALNHVETIHVDGDKSVQLITRSLKPPIFEIPDFLSSEECDQLIKLAKREGLEESKITKTNTVTWENVNATLNEKEIQFYCKSIARFDSNKDNSISLIEFSSYVYRLLRILVDLNDLWTVYKELLAEEAKTITYKDCMKTNRTRFVEFVYQLLNIRRLPYYKTRYSQHSWIELSDDDPILKPVKSRIAEVTQMSVWQIDHSEPLQVVYYQRSGHYHAHYDSSVGENAEKKRCCQRNEDRDTTSCLLCRYITMLFYLNDVAKGGETAFPLAGREDHLRADNYTRDLSRHCHKASLVVKPVKGTALLWYNNVLDEKTGKMGDVDKLTLHGGCDVLEGEKWIANLWINAPRGDETV